MTGRRVAIAVTGVLLAWVLAAVILSGNGESGGAGTTMSPTTTQSPTTGTSTPPATTPGEFTWLIQTPAEAAGLERIMVLEADEGDLPTRRAALAVAGLPVSDLVLAQYDLGPAVTHLNYYVGIWTETQAGLSDPKTMFEMIFAVNFVNETAIGPATPHPGEPMEGEVWCVTFNTGTVSAPNFRYACGWADETTVSYSLGPAESEVEAGSRHALIRYGTHFVEIPG